MTTKLSQSVYIGGVVDVKEIIKIDAKVDVDELSTSNNTYIGGVVDVKEIIKIEGVTWRNILVFLKLKMDVS